MRLVTFLTSDSRLRSGALIDADRRIVDLQAAASRLRGAPSPLVDSIEAMAAGGSAALELAAEMIAQAPARATDCVIDRTAVRLTAPIPIPPQMRDFLCFEKHLVQAFQQARLVRARQSPDPDAALREMEEKGVLAVPAVWYERPIFYHPNRLNVIGPDTDVHWPTYSKVMDFELEFAAVIGAPGKNIAKSQARAHIFGYTVFNDFSARDEQTIDMPGQLGPGKGKDFDGSNVLGPCIVTADEIADPYRLTMIARVNGEEWARGSTSEMRWSFEDCIAHASRSETIHSGEIFGSGTVGGGCGLESLRFLKSGDVVELEVEGIGVLRNRVLSSA